MPFGLKNVGATYQRTMHLAFFYQIGRNMEIYIDDLIIKSKDKDGLVADLKQIFQNMMGYWMMLNPTKCIFGVEEAKILGLLISHREIEANPKRIEVILNMESPKDHCHILKLVGHMVSLSHFISKLGEKFMPLFNLLRNYRGFEWTEEAEITFQSLKANLSNPHVLGFTRT